MMSGRQTGLRWGVRLLCLVVAALLCLGGPLPAWMARVVPGLSPLVVFSVALAGRGWTAGAAWLVPPLILLLLAMRYGRWFCRWMCPLGTLHALVPRVHGPHRWLRGSIGGLFFWAILVGALLGLPFYHVLDPLSAFARVVPWVRGGVTPAMWVTGIVVPLFLVWSAFQPMAWCTHVCPLGYLFGRVQLRPRPNGPHVDHERRRLLGGMLLGAVPAVLLPGAFRRTTPPGPAPLLPPGATTREAFARDCSRCQACVHACPTGILGVGWPGDRHVAAWFHPALDPERGVCDTACRACTQVCPTGAIQPLPLAAKQVRQVGIARVRRDLCLAWNDGVACTVCTVKCPFGAIVPNRSTDWIDRPEVQADRCTGCGYCEHYCPVSRDGRAILVESVPRQQAIATRIPV